MSAGAKIQTGLPWYRIFTLTHQTPRSAILLTGDSQVQYLGSTNYREVVIYAHLNSVNSIIGVVN